MMNCVRRCKFDLVLQDFIYILNWLYKIYSKANTTIIHYLYLICPVFAISLVSKQTVMRVIN